ncbi:hypothetical protein LPJ72_002417 [Coemansia sp. Benny D160-2]|nr:hypothetical protein LPJ72_002417 [Coemansia sp. Benny D160-2]
MSNSLYSKQLLTEGTKFRVLCFMYQFFRIDENNIATLANQTDSAFQQLLGHLVVNQPNLQTAGKSIQPILESFISNQNSRIFCALADLYEWYRTNMGFEILQLTLKHINSIFRRPPYELRPYTRELTYAQRLIMIYHVCDPSTWGILTNAYELLYRSQYSRPWEDKEKFLPPTRSNSRVVPADAFRTIQECMSTRIFVPSLLSNSAASEATGNRVAHSLSSNALLLGSSSGGGKVIKRRAFSAVSKLKTAKEGAMGAKSLSSSALDIATSKPRSISFGAGGSSVDSVWKPAFCTDPLEFQTQPLMFNSANSFVYPANWLTTTVASVPVQKNDSTFTMDSQSSISGLDFSQAQQMLGTNNAFQQQQQQHQQHQQQQQQPQQLPSSQLTNVFGLNSNEIASALSLSTSLTVPPTYTASAVYSEPFSQQTVVSNSSQFDGTAGTGNVVSSSEMVSQEDAPFYGNLAFSTSLMEDYSQ